MKKEILNNKKGFTLVIALVLLAVMIAVGVAVLSAASNARGSVVQRDLQRQSYFMTKSAAIAVDNSMRGGNLGKVFKGKVFNDINGSKTMTGSVALSGSPDSDIDDCEISSVTIEYSDASKGNQEKPLVTINGITVDFSVTYRDITKNVKLSYDHFEGQAILSGGSLYGWQEQVWASPKIDF